MRTVLQQMVVRVGLAPTVFLVWQIYSLLRSLLSHLTFKLVGATRFELASHALKVRCITTLLRSNKVVRAAGLEPAPR